MQELTNSCLWSGVRCAIAAPGSFKVHVAGKLWGILFSFFKKEKEEEERRAWLGPVCTKTGFLLKHRNIFSVTLKRTETDCVRFQSTFKGLKTALAFSCRQQVTIQPLANND